MAKRGMGSPAFNKDKQREIASKGGKAAHLKGTAHQWTSEEASKAGAKGGLAPHRPRRRQAINQHATKAKLIQDMKERM